LSADQPSSTASEIVGKLDLPTKIGLLSGRSFWSLEPLPDHGLDEVFVADGPHGLRAQGVSTDHLGLGAAAPATCFPTAATLGSTWDVALLDEVGGALAVEAAALGVSVVLGPGLNIKRHPAGGRCFEYLSEDPHLSGKLAAAMVRGVQRQGIGTSIKHFAVNNQESHRLVVDAVVDERTLRELYLTGFEIVVREAAPWTVMCAYNLVNGTYASEHHELLTTILREEWGFDGLVMTDWGAANERVAAIAAGLDLEMPSSGGAFDAEVADAVAGGRLDEAAIDRCAERVVGLIQRAQAAPSPPAPDVDAHHQLARRAAAAGSVLLTNRGVLPLQATGRIAVIGSFATEPRYQGAGSSQVNPTRVDRALDALRARVGGDADVTFAAGFEATTGEATAGSIDEAVANAITADVAVVFAGLPAPMESEGFDRTTLDLPAGQLQLIEALAATPTPVVVVLNNGGVVHLPWADRVDAVLECWLGGQAGGTAAVDVLFGDAEPGGRLAESIPHHVAQLPADRNFPGSPRQVEYREGLSVGYRFHDRAKVPARFAFGAGGSYTTFAWSDIELTGAGTDVRVQVRVTNTGDRPGSDVVQVYVRDVESSAYRPDKELKGFAKAHLEPGDDEVISITLDRRSFATWDVAAHDWLVEAGRFEVLVARSSVDIEAAIGHDVDSADAVVAAPAPASFVATDAEFVALLGRPVPAVPPTRPFNRNSTLEDLETTRVGRLLSGQVVRAGIKRAASEFPDPDEATLAMIRAAIREGPLRGLVLMSGGMISFEALDRALDLANGEWRAALRSKGGLSRG